MSMLRMPQNFPVNRIRLSKVLGGIAQGAPARGRALPPLNRTYAGKPPAWDGKGSLESVRNIIASRRGGTLQQTMTQLRGGKGSAGDIKTHLDPHMDTTSHPINRDEVQVEKGNGSTRDADVSKAATDRAREMLKAALQGMAR